MKYSFLARSFGLLACLVFARALPAQTASLTAATAVAASNLTTGTAVTPFVPVTAAGGTGSYTFAVTPALPAGLSFDASTGAVSGTPDVAGITPGFIGYDSFNAGLSTRWSYGFQFAPNTPGALTATNGRLEFTKATGAGSYVRGWDSDPSSTADLSPATYNQSWTADITVMNNAVVASGEFVTYGIEVTDAQGHYSAIMLGSTDAGRVVRAEGTGVNIATVKSLPGTGSVHVRLLWDAGAKALHAVYSVDGQSYTWLASFNPEAQWGAAPTGGFYVEVFGNSNAAAAITSGSTYGDNFKFFATAPTTYTVTATDTANATAASTFQLVVAAPPISAVTAVGGVTLTTGMAATPFAPSSATGGLSPYSYSVFPALSAGLTLDPTTGMVSGTPAPGTSTPLFVGSDNFDTGSTSKWEYNFRTGGVTNGSLDFANGRVEFTKGTGAGNMIVGWDGDPTTPNSRSSTSRATNWVADVTVTNNANSANESYSIGFQASAPGQYGSVILNSNNGALSIIGEGSNVTTSSVPVTAATVRLRLTWDAASGALKALYSVDNGATYSLAQTYHPLTEWTAGAINNGFFFELVARSNSAAAIASGVMSLDNFAVTATQPATTNYTLSTSDRVGAFAQTGFSVTLLDPPAVAAISPANAPVGSKVTLSGSYLAGVTAVTFGGVNAAFTYNATTQTISATVPSGARSGAVQVTTAAGTSAGFAYTVPLTTTSTPFHNVVTLGQSTSLSVSLAGGAQGGTYTYQWRKDGTPISGATNSVYYVAALAQSDVGDYDVQVSDGTTTFIAGPAALRAATPSVWTWLNPQPTGSDLNAVAYGAGRYVAVGSAGTLLTSTDGTTWTAQPQQPAALFFAVGFNGSQFLVTGSHGSLLTSSDGLTWTQHSLGTDVSLGSVTYGNGKWVGVGGPGGIFTSTDGATWVRQTVNTGEVINGVTATSTGFMAVTSGGSVLTGDATATTWTVAQPLPGKALIDVAQSNGAYVIAASQHVFTSTDGSTWTEVTVPTTDPGIDWNRVIVTSAGFTVAGASYSSSSPTPRGYVIQSANGTSWTKSTVPGAPGLTSVATNGTNFVAVGFTGQISTSSDGGATFSNVSTGLVFPGDLNAAATGPAGTLFAGGSGVVFQSPNHLTGWTRVGPGTSANLYGAVYAGGKYVIVGDDAGSGSATVLSSTTGAAGSWTTASVSGTALLSALAFDGKTGRYIAAGAGSSIYTATDPAGMWTPLTKPTTAILRAGTNGGGKTVLVGDGGTIVYSSDDQTWTSATSPTGVSLQTVTYGNGRFIAGGSTGARSTIITSTDGVTWQNVPVPFTGSIRASTYADGRFLTVGGSETILYSSDGLNWSADTSQFAGLFRALVRTPVGLLAGGTGGAIAVIPAPTVTTAVSQKAIATTAATTFTPVTATGGHAPYTFSVSPALPAGLTMDPATGAIAGTATSASVPFAGSDDFSGGDGKWAYYFRNAGAATQNGMLAFTNSRLDFSKGANAGTYFLGWDGDANPATVTSRTTASFGTSWVSDVTVTNTYVAAANEYGDIGFEAAANGQWLSILLLNRGGSLFIRGTGTGLTTVEQPITATTVKLRLAWDASAQLLSTFYSVDGGATYTALTTNYAPTTLWAPGTAAGGFNFEIFGESNAAAAVAAGAIYADDFSIRQTSPAAAVYTVTATDSLGFGTRGTFSLTVQPAPTITSFTPTQANAGTTVTITGTGFSDVTIVRFHGVAATTFHVDSDTQITATVPTGADTGPVSVQTSLGAFVASSTVFTVPVLATFSDQPIDRRVAAGGVVGWFTTATGTAPLSFSWSKDGAPIAGATTLGLILPAVNATSAGAYAISATNPAGTATSQSGHLTVLPTDAVLWQAFTANSTEQAPARSINVGGKVYLAWSAFERAPDFAGGHIVGGLARFNETDGTLDSSFHLDPKYHTAQFVAAQSDGKLVIAVRGGDANTVIRTSDTGVVDATFAAPQFAYGVRFITLQGDGKVVVAATDNLYANAPAGAVGADAPKIFRLNSDGSLDTRFTPAALNGVLFGAPAVDASGRIYLAGSFSAINGTTRVNIARLNADGSLDTGYADPANIAGFGSAQARTALVQSDGRVVFVGGFWTAARGSSGDAIQAIRFNADGSLDTTFAMPLRSQVGLGTGGQRLRAAALNADDTIVAVSDRMVRLTKDGAVDATFNGHGLQKEAFWVSVGTNGKLFVPDEMGVRNIATIVSTVANGVATFAADGTPDFSFQTGGYGRVAYSTAGAVLSDGRVWVAGNFNRYGGTVVPGLAQFGTDGALTTTRVSSTRSMTSADVAAAGNDAIFAILTTPADSAETNTPQLVRIQPNGAIDATFTPAFPSGYDLNAASLSAGPSGTVFVAQGSVTPQSALAGNGGNALVRLTTTGGADSSYSATLSSLASVTRNTSNAVTMITTGGLNVAQALTDGRALVIKAGIDGSLKLLRLTAAGAVDTSFNAPNFGTIAPSVGYTSVITDPVTNTTNQFPLTTYSASDLVRTAVQTPNGQVYVGGRLALNGSPVGLIRLNADGSLDTTFTGVGLANSDPNAAPYVCSLAVDAAGRVYVAGRFTSYNGVAEPGIFRLAANGTLDTTWSAGFTVLDVPAAAVQLGVVGETLYAVGTVNAASGTLPGIYRTAPIPGPLVIAQQPVSATVLVGAPASLSVTVNSSTTVSYQWYKGTSPIPGATSATLSIASATLGDEGSYFVVATNAAGYANSNPVSLTVNAAPAITSQPAAASVIIGSSATFSVTATGKPAVSYQWYKGTAAITGATNASLTLSNLQYADAGNYSVLVSNSAGAVTSSSAALSVTPVAPVVTSPTSISGIAGRSFLYAITTNPTPVTFSVTGLPAGLTLDSSSGVISGTPATAGSYAMVVSATNATSSDSRTVAVTITPPPPIINSALSSSARVGAAFNYAIQATGIPTSYNADGLPAGLNINTTSGVISGTPSVYGTFTVTLSATNAGGTVTRSLVITVDPALNAPVYSGAPSLSGTAGATFSFTPTFSSATGYALVALPDSSPSTLPAGLTFNTTTGAITGTPTQTGTFPLALQATNTGGSTTVNLTLTVNPAPTAPAITSASSASGVVGSTFTFTLTSTPAATSFSASNLPAGLTLSGATISGTPSVFGTFNVSVSATNSAGTGAASVLVVSIAPSPNAPTLTNSAVVTGTVGTPLTAQLTATNTPTAWEIVSGSLPVGLGFDTTTGAIAGTPNAAGQVHVWFAARNASGRGYALEMLFNIKPAATTPVITSNGSATGQVGQPFQYLITATNAPTSFAAVGLPAGLSLNATSGVISGVPVTATTQPVAITLTAAAGTDVSLPKVLLLSVAPAPATPQVTSAATAAGQVGNAFSYQVTASENATSFSALNLPPGLSLNATTGAISGTPTQAGSFTVTLQAANAAGAGQTSTLAVSIAPALTAPAITSAAATSGKVGVALTYTATAAPTPISSFTLTGTLPLGLSFNTSTGVLSGKPTESGLFTVSLTASGAGGTSLPQSLVILVNPADNVPVVTSPIFALATVGSAFQYTITATNINAVPVTYDAVGLPAGLALNQATGVIEGQPTETGQFVVSLVVTNAAGSGPVRTLTILIQPAATAPVVTSSTSAAAQVGQPFVYQIAGTNSPTSYDVSGAPAWMVINTGTGAISGTPTAPGNYTVGVTATNAAGTSNAVMVTLAIAPAANTPVITSTRTATGKVSAAFSYTITASNSPTAFVATGLPAGLSVSSGGVISGTPTVSGQFEITLLASNGNGTGAPVTLILTIQPNISFVVSNP